ncbi:hypothetical protein CIP107518_01760 [Corynebacterium diphtheriae]|nr:hypothetical protein CIP107518_01760 [Corynebacterium diphtheriae]
METSHQPTSRGLPRPIRGLLVNQAPPHTNNRTLSRYTDSDKVLARIHHDYPGATVATITQTRGREQTLLTAGADVAVYLYEGVGDELADQAVAHLRQG